MLGALINPLTQPLPRGNVRTFNACWEPWKASRDVRDPAGAAHEDGAVPKPNPAE
jgi:hypothetical protein